MTEIKLTLECPELVTQLTRIADALENKKATSRKTSKKEEKQEPAEVKAPEAEAPQKAPEAEAKAEAEEKPQPSPKPAQVVPEIAPEEPDTPADHEEFTLHTLQMLGRDLVKVDQWEKLEALMKSYNIDNITTGAKKFDTAEFNSFGRELKQLRDSLVPVAQRYDGPKGGSHA